MSHIFIGAAGLSQSQIDAVPLQSAVLPALWRRLMERLIAEDHGARPADAIAEMCLHARRRDKSDQIALMTAHLPGRHPS